MKKNLLLLLFLASVTMTFAQKYTISGYIRDKESGESLIGANFYVTEIKSGTVTNLYGFYSITLPVDTYEVIISYVGYAPIAKKIALTQDVDLNIELTTDAKVIGEVVVSAKRNDDNVERPQMGVIDLPIKQVKALPALGGEKDILKAVQLLPGVQSGNEASAGFYVRGGGPDQNLVLLDEAVVYNPFHLAGFVSVFNADAIKNVQLIKGGFPAQYGGRLSSILDISMKDGNAKQFHGEGGVGLISSRLTLEGPIIKDKTTFMASGRRFYWDVIIKPFLPKGIDFGYSFYDLNLKLNHKFSDNDRLYVSGYFGKDAFNFGSVEDSIAGRIAWGNSTLTTRWNHVFSKKLFANTTLIYNDYDFRITSELNSFNLELQSGIKDVNAKVDFDYYPHILHKVKFGANYIYHTFIPSIVSVQVTEAATIRNEQKSFVTEAAVYANDEYDISDRFGVNLGLRSPIFYERDTAFYGLEPRFTAKYSTSRTSSVKFGYTLMNQFIHLATNNTLTLPTDLWIPSSKTVKPQRAQQVAAGYFRNFKENEYETSVEVYYKDMRNLIEYKEGANIFLNPNIERELVFGRGWSYGAEFFIQKKTGRINGWIGYTLSWTKRQFDALNQGEPYAAKYDRRHDLAVVGFYDINDHWSVSAVFVYGSGHALSLPQGRFYVPSQGWGETYTWYSDYGQRNAFKLRPYNRMDLGLRYEETFEKWVYAFSFDLYNIYNRRNPYFVYLTQEVNARTNSERFVVKQVSLLPFIPTVTLNFKF